MASFVISNSATNFDESRDSRPKKRKKSQIHVQKHDPPNPASRWGTVAEQQAYSSRLRRALRRPAPSATDRPKAVHRVADRVLAASAKGRTRWSQAILSSRLRLGFAMKHRKVRRAAARTAVPKKPPGSAHRQGEKILPSVQTKARDLGRLIPGCRAEPLPVILDEAADYIAALQMQIRAMTALVERESRARAGTGVRPSLASPTTSLGRPPPW